MTWILYRLFVCPCRNGNTWRVMEIHCGILYHLWILYHLDFVLVDPLPFVVCPCRHGNTWRVMEIHCGTSPRRQARHAGTRGPVPGQRNKHQKIKVRRYNIIKMIILTIKTMNIMYTCIYVYIYIYMYTHTYIYIYIHKRPWARPRPACRRAPRAGPAGQRVSRAKLSYS